MDANEKSEYEKAKVLLNGYLNERLRVTISDGRVIDGRLICTDRDCNLVLSNCEEFLSKEEMSEFDNQGSGDIESTVCARQPRTLSMAIVPGEHIKEIVWARQQNSCLEESTHEANSPDIDDGHAKDRTDCVSIPP